MFVSSFTLVLSALTLTIQSPTEIDPPRELLVSNAEISVETAQLISVVPGVRFSSGNEYGCFVEACSRLRGFIAEWSTGRISDHSFLGIWPGQPGTSLIKIGGVEEVSDGGLTRWPPDAPGPGSTPQIQGFRLVATARVPDTENTHIGIWRSTGARNTMSRVMLFSDSQDRQSQAWPGCPSSYTLVSLRGPVDLASVAGALHGRLWSFVLISHPRERTGLRILRFQFLPHNMECAAPSPLRFPDS